MEVKRFDSHKVTDKKMQRKNLENERKIASQRLMKVLKDGNEITRGHKPPYKHWFDCELDESLLEEAKHEVNETEANILIGKKMLKELLVKNNLPFKDDEDVLMRFLRAKKYRYQESFEMIKHFIKAGKVFIRKFGVPQVEDLRTMSNSLTGCVSPYRDKEGSAVLFVRAGIWMDKGVTYPQAMGFVIVLAVLLAEMPATQVSGMSCIIDAKELRIKEIPHLIRATRFMLPLLRGYAARIKRVVIINTSPVFETIIKIAMSFMPQKVTERALFMGSNLEPLYRYYDPAVLPEEAGGTLGPVDTAYGDDLIEPARDLFRCYTDIAETV